MLAGQVKRLDSASATHTGLNRVRFMSPVSVGSRLRGQIRLKAIDPIEGGAQLTMEISIEREGSDKPVCVAEALSRRFT